MALGKGSVMDRVEHADLQERLDRAVSEFEAAVRQTAHFDRKLREQGLELFERVKQAARAQAQRDRAQARIDAAKAADQLEREAAEHDFAAAQLRTAIKVAMAKLGVDEDVDG